MSCLDIDEGELEELRALDRFEARRRSGRCKCGPDLPGHCPGPSVCPNNMDNDPEDADYAGEEG